MEHALILSLLLFVFTFVCLFLHHFISKRAQETVAANQTSEKPPLPPGTTSWPLIGETLDYFSKVLHGCPEKFVSERRDKYSSKVFRTSIIGQPMAILGGAEGNKLLFSNESKSGGQALLTRYSPKSHNKTNHEDFIDVRKMLSASLKVDALQKFVGTTDAVMKQHLQTDWDRDEVKVSLVVKGYSLALACRLFLSISDPREVQKLAKPIEDISKGILSMAVNFPGTAFSRAVKASKAMRKEVEVMIKQRKTELSEKRAKPTQDILSQMLLSIDDNGRFSNEVDNASYIVGLLHGGYGTVNVALTSVMKYLAEHPDVYDEVLRAKEHKKPLWQIRRAKSLLSHLERQVKRWIIFPNGCPEKFISERRNKYSPKVFRTSIIGQPMAILGGAEENKILFSNESKLVHVWWPSSIDKIFPKSHNKTNHEDFIDVRKMLSASLKADALQKFVGTTDAVMKQHLQTDWDRDEVKVSHVVRGYTLALVSFVLEHLEVQKLANTIEDISKGILSMAVNFPGTAFSRAVKASKAMREEVEVLMKQGKTDLSKKRATPTQDVLSQMLLSTENGLFSNEVDIASYLVGLLHGGYGTVNAALTFLMKYLAEHPDVFDEVLRGTAFRRAINA
ncbi:hypothetical protein RJ639_033882 [Escallonia herrerae]|uniref:Cytochrome P450 n=1 Tax=Escallonia herrerae TaxID=1293975 RepID=A0AA89BC95_9ASTE|nr:hypothetical protein RJ639_033882 [Escallonia herrerae]